MSQPSRVAIRVDGNAALGMGHLRRCLILARTLDEHGYEVRFVRRERRGGILIDVSPEFSTSWLEDAVPTAAWSDDSSGELKDADATLSLVGEGCHQGSWIIVDHYCLGWRWESRVRAAGHRILTIDDFRNRRHCADVLVSGSPEPFVPASNVSPAEGRQLVGFPYAFLDREHQYDESTLDPEETLRLLVTFGGSDPTGETAKVCEALQGMRQRSPLAAVDVVLGPGNQERDAVEHLVRGLPEATVHVAPDSLALLIRRASLVITSGGNTLVEALALRKPCLVIVTAENQQLIVEQLRARNLLEVLGWHSAVGTREIQSTVEAALYELPALTSRVRQGSCFDHLGPRRIVAAMREVETPMAGARR
jgi:UDP-2,4-diacetamido-2,4,6-trideoxy-beta-L-altropyranose hydrolase